MIKPYFAIVLSVVGLVIIILLSEFSYGPILNFLKYVLIYIFFVILPLLWIQYIIHNYDKLNRAYYRNLSWKKTLIPEIIIATGAMVILLMTQTTAFTWISNKQYDNTLYFFAFCTIMSAIYISIELSKNQRYFANKSQINSMNYMLIGFLIYLGPIGLTFVHNNLIKIVNSLSTKK